MVSMVSLNFLPNTIFNPDYNKFLKYKLQILCLHTDNSRRPEHAIATNGYGQIAPQLSYPTRMRKRLAQESALQHHGPQSRHMHMCFHIHAD